MIITQSGCLDYQKVEYFRFKWGRNWYSSSGRRLPRATVVAMTGEPFVVDYGKMTLEPSRLATIGFLRENRVGKKYGKFDSGFFNLPVDYENKIKTKPAYFVEAYSINIPDEYLISNGIKLFFCYTAKDIVGLIFPSKESIVKTALTFETRCCL